MVQIVRWCLVARKGSGVVDFKSNDPCTGELYPVSDNPAREWKAPTYNPTWS